MYQKTNKSCIVINSSRVDKVAREGIRLADLLSDLGFAQKYFTIYEDNKFCVKLIEKWDHKWLKYIFIEI